MPCINRLSLCPRLTTSSSLALSSITFRPSFNPRSPDPRSLGPIIDEAFAEPWVSERLFGRDAFGGVVDEDFLEKVEELFVEDVVGGDDVLSQTVSACTG